MALTLPRPCAHRALSRLPATGSCSILITVVYTDVSRWCAADRRQRRAAWRKTVTLDPGVASTSVTATSVGGQLNCSIVDGSGAAVAVQANNTMIASCTR